MTCDLRHPMCLRHPVYCMWIRFLQKSPVISGSFAENDLQLKAAYVSPPPCILHVDSFFFVCVCGFCVRGCGIYVRGPTPPTPTPTHPPTHHMCEHGIHIRDVEHSKTYVMYVCGYVTYVDT